MSGPPDFPEMARAAWGGSPPDWVLALAAECHATSQSRAAARIGRSASLVSLVIRNRYSGDLAAVEDVVRGALMGATVACPALGSIPSNECRDWQAKAVRFVNVNSLRVRMFRACSGCPRNRRNQNDPA